METRQIERLTLDGAELEFVRIPARRRDVPSLVFLHEGLGSTGLWRDFPESIAARCGAGAIVYSRRGNGFSTPVDGPRPPAYMHEEASIVLPRFLDALQVRETILIGHSDGGSIAIVFAAEHPDRVRALVLEAPHLFVEPISVASIAAIRSQYETTDLRERMSRHHADVDRTFYGWNDIWLSPEFSDWNVEAYAARVRAPVLALQGVDDEYGTPAQIDAMAARAAGPVDRMLLAKCGHAPHRDRRGLVEAVVGDWIDEHLGALR
ncbi:MAG TPA: alpha/beta hydrolase [Candidatus Baltobacteraceae bacterium]|nr:alpha/beta hydrolase [Candidatus Baltobacteraceae bacterium]